eukprot:8204884-Pyramimonas_sp.AAC.1
MCIRDRAGPPASGSTPPSPRRGTKVSTGGGGWLRLARLRPSSTFVQEEEEKEEAMEEKEENSLSRE